MSNFVTFQGVVWVLMNKIKYSQYLITFQETIDMEVLQLQQMMQNSLLTIPLSLFLERKTVEKAMCKCLTTLWSAIHRISPLKRPLKT